MSINISDFFNRPSEVEWLKAVSASLKLTDDKQLQEHIESIGIEGLNYTINPSDKTAETYLNTFPTKRILGREINVGQPHTESQDVGIDYIFSHQPVVIHKDQKLIQIIDKKENKDFGDEVLLDIFSLLEQFEYSHEDLLNYLQKKLNGKNKNIHLLINAESLHNAGASIINELSHSLFLGLKYCDLFHEYGRKVCFMLSVDSLFYTQVAKIRALRYLYETILEKEKCSDNQFLIIAVSSLREMTLYDPWVNMLRVGTSTSAAFLGGADVILPKCFDVLNQVHNTDESSVLAQRQSRNVFHILNEESHLAFVNDPARGSYIIEDLTNQIIKKTFVKLKEMNSQKSLRFLYEKVAEEVKSKSLERSEEIQKRTKVLCGINNFAKLDENLHGHFKLQNLQTSDELFPLRRVASEFEILRLSFEAVLAKNSMKLLLLTYGDSKKISQRLSYCKNYFEVLGIEVEVQEIQSLVSFNPKKYAGVAFCAQDIDYTEMFEIGEIPSTPNLFIAGNKIQKQGFTNIYKGQNIFDVLSNFVEKVASK